MRSFRSSEEGRVSTPDAARMSVSVDGIGGDAVSLAGRITDGSVLFMPIRSGGHPCPASRPLFCYRFPNQFAGVPATDMYMSRMHPIVNGSMRFGEYTAGSTDV